MGRSAIEDMLGAEGKAERHATKIALTRLVKNGLVKLIGGQGGEYALLSEKNVVSLSVSLSEGGIQKGIQGIHEENNLSFLANQSGE
jgi:hypothetical protein